MPSRALSLKWWALSAVCLNILAVSLDGTILSVALPTLGGTLHASESDLEWFQSGYLLLLAAGALAKRFGQKLTVALGFVLLGTGAALGMATSAQSGAAFVAAWMVVLCAGTGLALTAATAAALSRLSLDRSGIGSAVVQAFQKTAGPLGTAVVGSVLTDTYQSRLDLGGLSAAAAALVRQSVYQGVALARQSGSAALAHSVRAAFVGGIDMSLLFSVGTAVAGTVTALAFLPPARHHGDKGR